MVLLGIMMSPSLKEKVSRLRMMLDGKGFMPDLIMGVSRGGLAVAALLSKQIGGRPIVPTMSLSPYPGFDNDFNRFAFQRDIFGKAGVIQILIVDDVCRQGKTLYDADSHVRRSINFPDVQIATAALTCYERVRSFDPTFIVETLGEPIERFGGDVEPFYS
jgi:hypoxanthine phosphoribosyltransferase